MYKVFVLLPISMALEILTDEWGRFPVTFTVGDEQVAGFAALNLVEYNSDFEYNRYEYHGHVRHLLRSATGVSIGSVGSPGGSLNISLPPRIEVLDRSVSVPNTNQRLGIAATPQSTLGQMIQGFLTTPITGTQTMIVFNPDNPENYAFEGQLFYASRAFNPQWSFLYGHTDLWGVNTAIRFTNGPLTAPIDDSSPFIPCLIGNFILTDVANLNSFFVPPRIFDNFHAALHERGISIQPNPWGPHVIFLENLDDETVDSLPTLQYVVQMEDGAQINVINVGPRDYIVQTDVPNRRRVWLAQARITDYCTFNKFLRDRMVIHFDNQNQRIGFGEPIVEL